MQVLNTPYLPPKPTTVDVSDEPMHECGFCGDKRPHAGLFPVANYIGPGYACKPCIKYLGWENRVIQLPLQPGYAVLDPSLAVYGCTSPVRTHTFSGNLESQRCCLDANIGPMCAGCKFAGQGRHQYEWDGKDGILTCYGTSATLDAGFHPGVDVAHTLLVCEACDKPFPLA